MPSKPKSQPSLPLPQSIPPPFLRKKAQILSDLATPQSSYSDKSPKGSVDVQIRDLIDEINAHDGFVTTSSCAGRVALFLEGPRPVRRRGDVRILLGEERRFWEVYERVSPSGGGDGGNGTGDGKSLGGGDLGGDRDEDRLGQQLDVQNDGFQFPAVMSKASSTTTPGGKGGGRWLYVSHDPISIPPLSTEDDSSPCKTLLGMTSPPWTTASHSDSPSPTQPPLPAELLPYEVRPERLIRLQFSPLILHVLCATLQHARFLLAAAINAGFRESGISSLKILEQHPNETEGIMVGIRTAGLAFESVVARWDGVVSLEQREDGKKGHSEAEVVRDEFHCLVDEPYIRLCLGVVNERFDANVQRRERFRAELRRVMEGGSDGMWEDGGERKMRKMREGLKRREEVKKNEQINGDAGEEMDLNLEFPATS